MVQQKKKKKTNKKKPKHAHQVHQGNVPAACGAQSMCDLLFNYVCNISIVALL